MNEYEKDVYEVTLERISYIFSEFENIYLAFSGGKDSGVMLHIVLDYMRRHGITRKVGVLYIDVEASYKRTVDFIERMYLDNTGLIEPYWACLPMTTTNSVSMYEPFWIFWDPAKRDKWVRPMPEHDFIINKDNHPFDFYRENMTFEEFTFLFGDWYSAQHGNKKTACLIGIRADESLNRYHAVSRKDKLSYKEKSYSTEISKNIYNFYPICDWRTEDIWTYYGKYGKPYNSIYDLFYMAGVPISRMRICEPYGDEQKAGLNLFKVLEPETWIKVVDRVSGANFGNIYCGTKAMGCRGIILPQGHTWKSYCKFLLKTLPKESRNIYATKFIKFIRYWNRVGSPVSEEDILELDPDIIVNTRQYSKRGNGNKHVVRFKTIPDSLPGLDNKTDFLSWKRMCMTILKNDITCRSLSFSMTKKQILRQQELIWKYERML